MMKKALQFFRKNPEIIFFIGLFVFWTAFMYNENLKEGGDFSWHDFKVEANGMIFDLFGFGVLVTVYNAIRARKEKIERLMEEIDDYRGWDEKEAMYRIVGAIKRLNKLGVSRIDLHGCFLEQAKLQELNLLGSDLQGANLKKADLRWTRFWYSDLRNAKLEEASVRTNWFELLELWNVTGREEIMAKFTIDEDGILRKNLNPLTPYNI